MAKYYKKRYIRSRSRSRYGGRRYGRRNSSYRVAAAARDKAYFTIPANINTQLTCAQDAIRTTPLCIPAAYIVATSSTGQAIKAMYDEFRIKSVRVQMSYNGSSLNQQVNMLTAVERNGVSHLTDLNLAEYGSVQSKSLNAYVSGSVRRSVVASTIMEKSVYWPSVVSTENTWTDNLAYLKQPIKPISGQE